MTIIIPLKLVFWATYGCWDRIRSIKFKYGVMTQFKTIFEFYKLNNPDLSNQELFQLLENETITIEIDKETFCLIMQSNSSYSHGIALNLNPILYDSLKIQLQDLVSQGNQEATDTLTEMVKIVLQNTFMEQQMLMSGAETILNSN